MRIEVNIEKKYFFGLILIGLVFIGLVGVLAYIPSNQLSVASWNNSVIFGHSLNELDWNGSIAKNVTAAGFCIGNNTVKSCITSWPGGGTGSQWTTVSDGIVYSGAGAVWVARGMGIGGSLAIGPNAYSPSYPAGQEPPITLSVSGNISCCGFVNANGVCIGGDCKTSWPSGGGESIGLTSCHWIGGSRCSGCRYNWVCPSGEILAGVGQQSTGETHLDYVYAYCCKISIMSISINV